MPLLSFASRSPAGCRIACCRVPPPRVTFCWVAAACIHPRPLLFVHASWLSRHISSHRLRLSTRRSFLLISPSLYLIVVCEWCVWRTGLDCRQCRHCHPIPPEIPVGSGGRSGVTPPSAPAKQVAWLFHWGQHQQRTAVVTPSVGGRPKAATSFILLLCLPCLAVRHRCQHRTPPLPLNARHLRRPPPPLNATARLQSRLPSSRCHHRRRPPLNAVAIAGHDMKSSIFCFSKDEGLQPV